MASSNSREIGPSLHPTLKKKTKTSLLHLTVRNSLAITSLIKHLSCYTHSFTEKTSSIVCVI